MGHALRRAPLRAQMKVANCAVDAKPKEFSPSGALRPARRLGDEWWSSDELMRVAVRCFAECDHGLSRRDTDRDALTGARAVWHAVEKAQEALETAMRHGLRQQTAPPENPATPWNRFDEAMRDLCMRDSRSVGGLRAKRMMFDHLQTIGIHRPPSAWLMASIIRDFAALGVVIETCPNGLVVPSNGTAYALDAA